MPLLLTITRQMKIVVLDGFTLNPGDLSWDALLGLGDVSLFDRSSPDEVKVRIRDAEIVLTNKAVIDRAAVLGADKLCYIGVTATGYNIVDIDAARERNVVVTNVPAYGTDSVAQHTFALLFELASGVGMHAQSVREGDWSRQPDFSYWKKPLVELHGKTFGIVGLGKIGRAVATIALAMGMKVLAVHRHPERDKMDGVRFTDMEECFRMSDVVSLHCSLNDENRGFVNRSLLSVMKPSAFLLNVSRGALINEPDLAEALNSDRIAGAGLDVLSEEPPPLTHPLLSVSNCIITPHQAWATQSARKRLMEVAVGNIAAFLHGDAVNRV